ncbi:hypothetical protein MRB53_000207 [Persea americana]|uniref:Uncharacterized protein n=1 Tax=Persea americana TaxID=3435 RepID=A0ACC2MN69_PERAE|nr:hypothetical protein MRB53_000207 [Persea americana]
MDCCKRLQFLRPALQSPPRGPSLCLHSLPLARSRKSTTPPLVCNCPALVVCTRPLSSAIPLWCFGKCNEEVDSKPLLSAPSNIAVKETKASGDTEVPFLENVYWKELCLLVFV